MATEQPGRGAPTADPRAGSAPGAGREPLTGVRPPAEDEPPRVHLTRRSLLTGGVVVVVVVLVAYLLVPALAGLDETWNRVEDGDPRWLAAGLAFTVLSFLANLVLFRAIYRTRGGVGLSLAESYQVTMASLAATRLLAAGGAGGIALSAWAMRRAGMGAREVADRSVTFVALTHLVYMLALVVGGLGLRAGVFAGPAPWAMTVLPAAVGAAAILAALALAAVPTDLAHRLAARRPGEGRRGRLAHRMASIPASVSAGVRDAAGHLRRPRPAMLGALGWWGFQILTLWASFQAFGDAPTAAVLVMGFFVGMLANLLPLPGGVGGVDGGMIGAFIAFGVAPGLALVAVLTYRLLQFWLPTVPGVLAWFQLRRTVRRWAAGRAERGVRPPLAVAG